MTAFRWIGLVIALGAGPSALAHVLTTEFVTSARVDLNGDRTKEQITLTRINDHGDFVLRVGRAEVSGQLGDRVDGFRVVDLDANDAFKEITVHTPGPSDDDEYLLYWYDGKVIRRMGYLARWPTFTDRGIVYVRDWTGFWEKVEKYVLDPKTRTLKLVPQEFHYVGVQGTVSKGIPLYETRQKPNVVASLSPKSKALILLSAGNWYVVKSATGLVGWAKATDVHHSFGDLPVAD